MKKVVLSALTVIGLSTVSMAQQAGCKYAKNEVDKFTKEQVLQTREQALSGIFTAGGYLTVSGLKKGTSQSLLFKLKTTQTVKNVNGEFDNNDKDRYRINVPEGSEILILLTNGNTVSLKSRDNEKALITVSRVQTQQPPPRVADWTVTNSIDIIFPLTEEVAKTLIENGATSTRLNYIDSNGNPTNHDCDFGKKKVTVLQDAVRCIQ